MFNIIKYRNYWYGISLAMFIASLVLLAVWGLKFGIDFTGGSLLEVQYISARPAEDSVNDKLAELNYGALQIQPSGENNLIIKSRFLNAEEKSQVMQKLAEFGELQELSYESIGPTIGQELRSKAIWGLLIIIIAIIAYVGYAFRKISHGPVPSWVYGVGAIIALVHDVVLVLGVFAVLGHYYGVELDALFVTALLTVLGYSVNDTIVVYDRIRENLKISSADSFSEIINESVNQTMVRSLNTGICALFTLIALFLFGGEPIKFFILALIAGIVFGTYSSLFIASPLLLIMQKLFKR